MGPLVARSEIVREAVLSNHAKSVRDVRDSFTLRVPGVFRGTQRDPRATTTVDDGFLPAVHAREFNAVAPDGIEVWKYAFPFPENRATEDMHVRFNGQWTGIFECARGRHTDVLAWPAANAVVVAASNAVYVVDPASPEKFSGVSARVEISGVTFDESAQHMFVADSLRVYAFSADRHFCWISEPLNGYDARFRGCGGRVLAVELKQPVPELEFEAPSPSVVRLRTEDGTVLWSRFREVRRHWIESAAKLLF